MKIIHRILAPFVFFRKKLVLALNRFPFLSFLIFLGLLFSLVVIGNALHKTPPVPPAPEPPVIPITVFNQSEQPMLDFTARVEKAGVITVVAQSNGIVQRINVNEGKQVNQGATLVSLSTTYQGGSTPSLSRQLAQRNTQYSRDTYDIQKDLIGKQRNIAQKQDTTAAELRDIGRKSLDDTRATISLNEDILNTLNSNIQNLENTNVGGSNDSSILAAKQGKAQVLSALANLRSGLRSSEYTSSDSNTPAQLSDATRDLTLRQLDLQEKSIDLARDVSELSLKLARVSEQLMYPAAPCPGLVERVYVHIGDSVNPGTPIATIRATKTQATAVVAVPAEIARQVNQLEPSKFTVNGKEISVFPRFVATEATEGSLYGILYTLPDEAGNLVTQGSSLAVSIPLGGKKLGAKTAIAPIDAIYQTPDKAYLYVLKSSTASAEISGNNQVAELREVKLGEVTGEYVRIDSGLQPNDAIITSRGITAGQKVSVQK